MEAEKKYNLAFFKRNTSHMPGTAICKHGSGWKPSLSLLIYKDHLKTPMNF